MSFDKLLIIIILRSSNPLYLCPEQIKFTIMACCGGKTQKPAPKKSATKKPAGKKK